MRNKFNLAGKISAVNEIARTYDIFYNDGRSDFNVPESDIRAPPTGKYMYFMLCLNIMLIDSYVF